MNLWLKSAALACVLALPACAARQDRLASPDVATPRAMTASQAIGADVYDARGRRVGEVEELTIGKDDEVTYAIVETGGFLGLGGRRLALPFDELRPRDGNSLMMSESLDRELRRNEALQRSPADAPTRWSWPRGYP